MEELLKQILSELKEIKENMGNLATRQEVEETESLIEEMKRVADTLETIAVGEVAVAKQKLEDKVEAGDMLLKSLIDGLETRLKNEMVEMKKEISEMKSEMNNGFKNMMQGLEQIANTQQSTAEILNAFVARFEHQDEINDLLKYNKYFE